MTLLSWQIKHKKVMDDFLQKLNAENSDYILKDGSSLMECYNLDRFSEDIDFDSRNKTYIKKFIHEFCWENDYTYRVAKDTDTVKRYLIHYAEDRKPLKIEISYRKKEYEPEEYTTINGIKVYTIEQIAIFKEQAYMGRDKIRDLYDIVFICNNYWEDLSGPVKSMIQNGFVQKGLEQFDYLMQTQKDELIDNDKLAEDILNTFDKLGIIDEKQSDMLLINDNPEEEQTIPHQEPAAQKKRKPVTR